MGGRIGVWMLLVAVGTGASPVAAEQVFSDPASAGHYQRVRSGSARLQGLIDEGLALSQTFRDLVAAIHETDGIVYVEEGGCRRGVRACLTWRLTLAGKNRILFVRVDSRRGDDDVIASVGHELQHTLEVLKNEYIRSSEGMASFYLKPMAQPRAIETEAAILAGNAVFLEARRSRSRSATK